MNDEPGDELAALFAKLSGPGAHDELQHGDAVADHLADLIVASDGPQHRSAWRVPVIALGAVLAVGMSVGTVAALGYHVFVRHEPPHRVPVPATEHSVVTSTTAQGDSSATTAPVRAPLTTARPKRNDDRAPVPASTAAAGVPQSAPQDPAPSTEPADTAAPDGGDGG